MSKNLPAELRGFYFPFNWDLKKLWGLPVEIQQLDVCELAWHLDVPIWSKIKGTMAFDLHPRKVLENPHRYSRHYKRALESDLGYAIDIMESGGRLLIIDGVHRLLKAIVLGQKNIAGRVIPRCMIPEFIDE